MRNGLPISRDGGGQRELIIVRIKLDRLTNLDALARKIQCQLVALRPDHIVSVRKHRIEFGISGCDCQWPADGFSRHSIDQLQWRVSGSIRIRFQLEALQYSAF